MESRFGQFRSILLSTLAMLALTAGLALVGATPAHAAGVPGPTVQLSRATVDGQPPAPDTCARFDSWCAFCTAMPDVTACKAFTPAHVTGTTTAGATGNSGNQPIPGVTSSGSTLLPNLPAAITGASS